MNNKWYTPSFFYLLGFTFIVALLAGAQYLQTYEGVNPCPLCLLQRIVFGLLGIIFLLGIPLSFNRTSQIAIGLLNILISIGGIALAGRQVWLQSLPIQSGANCEVSLQYMLNVLPLNEVIGKIFQGGSGCSQIAWSYWGITLAQWSLGFFILFLIFSFWQLRRVR